MELQRTDPTRAVLSDEEIVNLYWSRDEQAICQTDYKYKSYLFTVAYNIVHDSLDCEECLNDTYLGAWNAIPPSKPTALRAFLTTILRRIAVNRYHRELRKKRVPSEMTVALSELENVITDDHNPQTELDAERLGQVISDFVRSLPQRRRYIFMSRYYVATPTDTIAKELELSRSMIYKELAAIRTDLKEKLESEGYSL